MGIISGIVVYLCIWWVVIFCVLPIGNRPHNLEEFGTAGSAPENPQIKQKFIMTTIISAVLWLVVFGMIKMNVMDFRELAAQMAHEDYR